MKEWLWDKLEPVLAPVDPEAVEGPGRGQRLERRILGGMNRQADMLDALQQAHFADGVDIGLPITCGNHESLGLVVIDCPLESFDAAVIDAGLGQVVVHLLEIGRR